MAKPHNHKLIEQLTIERDYAQGELLRVSCQLAAARTHPWRNLWRWLRERF